MKPKDLARIALGRLPYPYLPEVTMHVFCEIERTPHLRRRYDKLAKSIGKDDLNRRLGKAVKSLLCADSNEEVLDVSEHCEIVDSVTLLSVGRKRGLTW